MDEIKHHIDTREGLCDTQKLPANIPSVPHVQSKRTLDPDRNSGGFRPRKSCTSQRLNLTQHIEDGYQKGKITGTAFVDLSETYDTVHHRLMIQKLYNTTQDSKLCRVNQNLLSNRRLYVALYVTSKWGANPITIRIIALTLRYSTAASKANQRWGFVFAIGNSLSCNQKRCMCWSGKTETMNQRDPLSVCSDSRYQSLHTVSC